MDERARLLTIAVGFRAILEDCAALADDPPSVRASLRQRTWASMALIDAALPAAEKGAVAVRQRSRSSAPRPLPGEGPCDCRPRSPRSARERRRRAEVFIGWALGALAGLLDVILPDELDSLDLPGRLRAIDSSRLAAVVVRAAGEDPASHTDVKGIASQPVETLADGGRALDAYVSALEQWSHG